MLQGVFTCIVWEELRRALERCKMNLGCEGHEWERRGVRGSEQKRQEEGMMRTVGVQGSP